MVVNSLPLVSALSFLSMGSTPAMAEGISAGTLIENTASASFDTGAGTQTVSSNVVVLRVDELLDATLVSLDTAPLGARSGPAVFTFELTNTGNGPESYRLVANPAVAGNDFDTAVDSIAVDSNGNGIYDPGIDEILTGPATTRALDPDATLTVFVLVTVPDTVVDGNESAVSLQATATTGTGTPGTSFQGQGVDGGDAIVGLTGATATASGSLIVGLTSVALVKSATVSDPFGGTSIVPGAIVTYSLGAQVSGSGSASDLVVTDIIPAGTTYRPGSLSIDGSTLTDAAGDDAGEASGTGISVDLGTVAGGTRHVITFDVTIN